MRILFLHEVGYLEKPIFEMHEFPEHLATMGHEVAFVDYPETQRANTTSSFGRVIQGRVHALANLTLYSVKALLHGTLGRLMAALYFPFFFLRVLRHFKPDVIVCFAVPTSGWQAAIICRLQGRPFIFRALDVSHKIRKTLFSPLVMIAERVVYRNSTWVTCNNAALRDYCVKHGALKENSSVELPPLELDHFLTVKQERCKLREKLGIADHALVVLYMGSFFYFSGLDRVVERLSKLEDKPHLVLIGNGEQDAELRKLVISLGLQQNVTFTGFIEYEDLPNYLSIADVAINPMVPGLVSNAALPNKVLQYMASGLAVVSTKLAGISSLFPQAEGLSMVSSPEQVLDAAISLAGRSNLSQIGDTNRKLVENAFDKGQSLKAFEDLLQKVLSS